MFVFGLLLFVAGGFAAFVGYQYLTQSGVTMDQLIKTFPPDFASTLGLMTVATMAGVLFALLGVGLIIGGAASKIVIRSADPLVLKSMPAREPVPSPSGYPENVSFCPSCGRPVNVNDDYCSVCGAKTH
jgi:hypothetical protein